MVNGGDGHRRQEIDPREHVVIGRHERCELERGRDQDRAVQPDSRGLLQHAHEPADAVPAVALAGDEDRRAPPAVPGEPAAHELAERLEIALVAEVLRGGASTVLLFLLLAVLGLVLDDAAEAGAHRIDEHEVGEREPRLLVLHEARRHRRQRAVGRERDPRRPDGTHVQIRRRRPRSTVEDEGHRPVAISLRDVRNREDLRRRPLLLAQDDPVATGVVVNRQAVRGPRGGHLRPRRRLVNLPPGRLHILRVFVRHSLDPISKPVLAAGQGIPSRV